MISYSSTGETGLPTFQFTDTRRYNFRDGYIFLGKDRKTGADVGMKLEKHGAVIATTRTGKGVGFIVPNLKRWRGSTVTIDPKGENAEKTCLAREAMGQRIGLIDPLKVAAIPDDVRERFGSSFNPLADIGPYTPRARERLASIARALTVVHDPLHMEWVDGCRSIIGGALAFLIATAPPDLRNLGGMRLLLTLDDDELRKAALDMRSCDACGGLAKAAASWIISALDSDKGLPRQVLQKARAATEWLDSPELSASLSRSDIDLSKLVDNSLTVYIVLSPEDIETYSGFLRLFIQLMLDSLTGAGTNSGANCLFILDEFYSLGKFDKVAEVMGRMAGYGVHVVPIVQNIGQVQALYGKETAETFFGNAEFRMFFGDGDALTLEYISVQLGQFATEEITGPPPSPPFINGPPSNVSYKAERKEFRLPFTDKYRHVPIASDYERIHNHQSSMGEHQYKMSWVGKRRLPAADIAKLIGKGVEDRVARSMIVFAKAGDVLNLALGPDFGSSNSSNSQQETGSYIASYIKSDVEQAHLERLLLKRKAEHEREHLKGWPPACAITMKKLFG